METGAEAVTTELDGVVETVAQGGGVTPQQYEGYSERQIRRYKAVRDYLNKGGTYLEFTNDAFLSIIYD